MFSTGLDTRKPQSFPNVPIDNPRFLNKDRRPFLKGRPSRNEARKNVRDDRGRRMYQRPSAPSKRAQDPTCNLLKSRGIFAAQKPRRGAGIPRVKTYMIANYREGLRNL